jgi:putative hydrolase of the HAD superfamily
VVVLRGGSRLRPEESGQAISTRSVILTKRLEHFADMVQFSDMTEETRREKSRQHVILIDCGDTLVDEATEEKDENGVTLRAELIPGADVLVRTLSAGGYRIALVADGFADTFQNILTQHGILDCFDTLVISELMHAEKPDPIMFLTAIARLGLEEIEDRSRVIMVGNHLARDIRGANLLGMTSVWLDWAPRRPKVPADEAEIPDFVIREPLELLALLSNLESPAGSQ